MLEQIRDTLYLFSNNELDAKEREREIYFLTYSHLWVSKYRYIFLNLPVHTCNTISRPHSPRSSVFLSRDEYRSTMEISQIWRKIGGSQPRLAWQVRRKNEPFPRSDRDGKRGCTWLRARYEEKEHAPIVDHNFLRRSPARCVPLSSPFILHFLPKKRHRNRFRTPYAAFHAVESKEKAFRAPLLHLSTPTLVHNPFFFVYNLYSRDRNCDVNSIKLIIY